MHQTRIQIDSTCLSRANGDKILEYWHKSVKICYLKHPQRVSFRMETCIRGIASHRHSFVSVWFRFDVLLIKSLHPDRVISNQS